MNLETAEFLYKLVRCAVDGAGGEAAPVSLAALQFAQAELNRTIDYKITELNDCELLQDGVVCESCDREIARLKAMRP